MSFHILLVNSPVLVSATKAFRLFSYASALCLLISSKRSLIAETVTTNSRGSKIAGWPPVIEIGGTTWRTIMKRKYTFASFENCSNRFFGINVSHVYFVVRILFLPNLLSWVLFSLILKFHRSALSVSDLRSDFLLTDLLSSSYSVFLLPDFCLLEVEGV